ncbi:hypothetical protein AB0B78_12940 [Streptomyces sp. NPDC040724]|uniref:hypothetical protein n=1 Tax=Streptomyces sp. NPDC040724 TaxID=3155612 RepID=UPI0033C3772D
MADLGLTALAVAVHAFRDHEDGLQILLDDLTHEELRIVARVTLLALGEAVRSTPGAEHVAAGIALTLEHAIYQDLTEGTTA